MSRYLQAWTKLPRVARWGIMAIAVIGFYFFPVEPLVIKIGALNSSADSTAASLGSFAESKEPQDKAVHALQLGIKEYGDVEFPGDAATRPVAFNSAVNKILEEQKVSNQKSRTKTAALGQGPLTTAVGTQSRVERVVRDIEFDATPETVAKVVAQLERSPLVATVSRVQVRQNDSKDHASRQVHAVITAEAWLVGAKKG